MPHDYHPLPTYSCESQDLRGNLVTSVTLKDEKVIKHIGSNCLMRKYSYTNSVMVTIAIVTAVNYGPIIVSVDDEI